MSILCNRVLVLRNDKHVTHNMQRLLRDEACGRHASDLLLPFTVDSKALH